MKDAAFTRVKDGDRDLAQTRWPARIVRVGLDAPLLVFALYFLVELPTARAQDAIARHFLFAILAVRFFRALLEYDEREPRLAVHDLGAPVDDLIGAVAHPIRPSLGCLLIRPRRPLGHCGRHI